MELKRPYLFLFFALHLVVGICCLLVAIAITIVEGRLSIQCGLFMETKKTEGLHFKYYSSAPEATCKYLKWMPGINVVVSSALAIYYFYPGVARQPRFYVKTTICWVITIITGVLLFVASCIISAGFQKSCRALQKVSKSTPNLSCKAMFDSTTFEGKPGDGIYTLLSMAEASSWIALLATAVCIIISSLYLYWRRCRDTMSTGRGS